MIWYEQWEKNNSISSAYEWYKLVRKFIYGLNGETSVPDGEVPTLGSSPKKIAVFVCFIYSLFLLQCWLVFNDDVQYSQE